MAGNDASIKREPLPFAIVSEMALSQTDAIKGHFNTNLPKFGQFRAGRQIGRQTARLTIQAPGKGNGYTHS